MSFDYALTRSDTGLQRRDDGRYYRANANEPIGVIGTDGRPIGAWIPKALTNLFRNSEPATDPGQGTRTAITFSACDWALGFNTALAGMVTFLNNSTGRAYYNTAALTASTAYSFAFIIKPDDGVQPTFGTSASNIGYFVIGNVAVTSGYTVTPLGGGYFFVNGTASTGVSGLSNNGIEKGTISNSTGFEVSAIMIVQGNVAINIFDYIRATGSSATRAVTDIRNTSFPLLASLQGFIDVEVAVESVNKRILKFGADDNNYTMITVNGANQIVMNYVIGGATIWSITSSSITSGRYRIAYYLSDGLNILWIDNTEINRNTSGYAPQGAIKVVGGNLSGTSFKLLNSSAILEYWDSGLSEAQIEAIALDYSMYGGSSAFKGV